MSGLLTTLLIGGLIIGGAVILINPENRCSYLGLCGQTAAAAEDPAAAAEEEVTPATDGIEGNDAVSGTSGCCKCEHQGGKVKCIRNNTGSWFNPPAGAGGSNDSDVGLSLQECNKGCGTKLTTSNTGLEDPSKPATKQKKAAVGSAGNPGSTKKGVPNKNNSVTGSGQKITPKTTATKQYFNANPKGYKPGGGTYYTNAYMANQHYYSDAYYAAPPIEVLEYQIERTPKDERNRTPYYVRGGQVYSTV